jgi:hypothetical protein
MDYEERNKKQTKNGSLINNNTNFEATVQMRHTKIAVDVR